MIRNKAIAEAPMEADSNPEPKTETETNMIDDFIDGRVLEVRKFVDKFQYLVEYEKEVFRPGETITIKASKMKRVISDILHPEKESYPFVPIHPKKTPSSPRDPRDETSTAIVFDE